jgi:2-dehydro-3-deoxyphosphogluconate aldolase/(4S)-4-hydroxy-2-oxoglutarate aldolase
MQEIERIMRLAPVIPVLVIDDVAKARPIAEAIVAGGLSVFEVTLRTPVAFEAIEEMSRVEGAVVGAGTVLNEGDLDRALDAGARFVVSPGLTDRLGACALLRKAPFLPGVATAGEVMRGLEMGFSHFKFFPAEASGGVAALNALSGPFSQAVFCPTGGVTLETAPQWLALPNVVCVGGTWLSPKGVFDAEALTAAARRAAQLTLAA